MGHSGYANFDLIFENNTKTYLTKCLTFAHANNNRLQSQMKKYFDYKNIKIKCKYQSAPVKLRDQCIVKATTDYGKKGTFFLCVFLCSLKLRKTKQEKTKTKHQAL